MLNWDFCGLFFLMSEGATEISITGVGTIKAAVEQATVDAKQITEIKTRIEGQSATIDAVAKEAKDAKTLSERLEQKNKEAEEKLKTIDNTLEKASSVLKGVEAILQATRDYYSEAQLNMLGKLFPDGQVIFNTPISQALEGTFTMNGTSFTFKEDAASESKYRDVINKYPKFQFTYWNLASVLRNRNDPSWKGYVERAFEILEKTTLVAGHHAHHDLVLKQAKTLLVRL